MPLMQGIRMPLMQGIRMPEPENQRQHVDTAHNMQHASDASPSSAPPCAQANALAGVLRVPRAPRADGLIFLVFNQKSGRDPSHALRHAVTALRRQPRPLWLMTPPCMQRKTWEHDPNSQSKQALSQGY
jgi:hypothetical protein